MRPLSLTRILRQDGFATPADAGAMTNFVEIGQARDKILSLKLDQVRPYRIAIVLSHFQPDIWYIECLRFCYFR